MKPPWAYRDSALLGEPEARPTIASVCRRLALFKRDGIIDIGSRLLWHMWGVDDVPEDVGNVITRAYAPSLISLGCMCGGDPSLPRPTELEFRLLCWELHLCEEPPTLDSDEARAVVAAVRDRWKDLPTAHLLRRAPAEDLGRVWAEHVIGLVAQAQGRPFTFWPSDLVRPLLVYEQFRDSRRGEAVSALRRLERAFFGVEWETFLRAFLFVIGIGDSDPLGPICPGRIDIVDDGVAPDAPFGVQPADLQVALSRLGTKVTEVAGRHEEVVALPTTQQKYHPLVRQLDTRPVILLDDYDEEFAVAIPSPRHFRMATETLVLDEFFAFARAHEQDYRLGEDAYSARGGAFHSYLSETLCRNGIVDVDRHAEVTGSKPDFLWVGERYGVIIEAKIRLGPNSDPWGRSAMSMWESWQTGARALGQAASFLGRRCDGLVDVDIDDREWLLLIVTMQPLAAEATSFRTVAKHWGLLRDTGFRALAVVSPGEVEHHVLISAPDDYAAMLCRAWDEVDPHSPSRPAEGFLPPMPAVPPLVKEGWARLFPGIPSPWES